MRTASLRHQLNEWGRSREPFLLIADFELAKIRAFRLSDIDAEELLFDFQGVTNSPKHGLLDQADLPSLQWTTAFIDESRYQRAFDRVQSGLQRGDSFLTNLTFPTQVATNWSLKDIFRQTQARYRLWWKEEFVVFSPEIFVQIRDGRIHSFPMKGTLAGHLPSEWLLNNPKEKAEHATIVDLIRNDLSQVAKRVRVTDYRYLERLNTQNLGLWQTSTRISGELPTNYHHELGDLLFRLLPAGSISGAPKPQTVRIIQEAEGQRRGYYTGIAALWDGFTLDSCVLIRYLEKHEKGLRYWSGGGITAKSVAEEEYKELKEKVYLPVSLTVSTNI